MKSSSDSLTAGALTFICTICVIYGLYTIYSHIFSTRLVNIEPDRSILLALRGLAWICVGIVAAIFAAVCAIIANPRN